MKAARVRPTGTERSFGNGELIVSKTDTKGVIRYANDVFLRVAALDRADVLGQPHNIIRHPDMPRGVFHLLWETISAGKEMFAYINNLAADGSHYWVLAHVTPTLHDGRILGYHSNRRRPERAAVEQISAVYARMRTVESSHPRTVDGAAASAATLVAELAEAGSTYDRYIWSLITPGLPARSTSHGAACAA